MVESHRFCAIEGIIASLVLAAPVWALIALALLLLGGCSSAWDDRFKAAETVAVAACKARADAPIVATAIRNALEESAPGGTVARGVVTASCELLGVKQ